MVPFFCQLYFFFNDIFLLDHDIVFFYLSTALYLGDVVRGICTDVGL